MTNPIPDFLQPAIAELMSRRAREIEAEYVRYVVWPDLYREEGGEG